jgi:hypothetical protein
MVSLLVTAWCCLQFAALLVARHRYIDEGLQEPQDNLLAEQFVVVPGAVLQL